jgi:hypothetical protein
LAREIGKGDALADSEKANTGWLDHAGGGHHSIYILSLYSRCRPRWMASALLFMLCPPPAPHYPGPDFTYSPRCQGRDSSEMRTYGRARPECLERLSDNSGGASRLILKWALNGARGAISPPCAPQTRALEGARTIYQTVSRKCILRSSHRTLAVGIMLVVERLAPTAGCSVDDLSGIMQA